MFQKMLVPLDGSKRAEAILEHVEELTGRGLNGTFHAVCKRYRKFMTECKPSDPADPK